MVIIKPALNVLIHFITGLKNIEFPYLKKLLLPVGGSSVLSLPFATSPFYLLLFRYSPFPLTFPPLDRGGGGGQVPRTTCIQARIQDFLGGGGPNLKLCEPNIGT